MKNWIALWLFFLNVCVIKAQQYSITTVQLSNPLRYECTIAPKLNNVPFDELDLVTWIFPDGQFRHQTIGKDNSGAVMNSSTFTWQPYRNSISGPGNIIAYVAKKGKPGNPAISVSPVTVPTIPIGTPATFAMAAGSTWQINQTWEFSPGQETFLIVSYKIPAACTTGVITLLYNPAQLDTVPGEIYAYYNESIVDPAPAQGGKIIISNLLDDDVIHHIYVKFKLAGTVSVESNFQIAALVSGCGPETTTTLSYLAKGTPHDPNEKLVNHRIVCAVNTNQTDLKYYIKFQNNGDDFVDSVEVVDDLPLQLIPGTISLGNVPDFQRVYGNFNWITSSKFALLFKALHLPGLNQTNPHYAYDQTTYGFDFNICAAANMPSNIGFANKAEVYFYTSQHIKLPAVYTNEAKVAVELVPTCYNAQANCILPITEQAGIISSLTISPNPFTEEILISLDLEEKTRLQAIIRDLNGRLVDQLTNSEYTSGAHEMHWNAAQIPSGVYLLDVRTEHGRITRKIIKM